jgi:hypothetical protein
MTKLSTVLWIAAAIGASAAGARAQFGNAWVGFAKDQGKLADAWTKTDAQEKHFAPGDLDLDGDVDLVMVRKQPFDTGGKQAGALLMNEGGVLTDRTALYASTSSLPGDAGLSTPTNAKRARLADLNGDGWLDLVTVSTINEGNPKSISHPRVYVNLGGSPAWLGLRHEDERVPQLFTTGGQPAPPRFMSVGVGDVDLDGALDLYCVDMDSPTDGSPAEPGGTDLNDRLLMNDGAGAFADESALRMTTAMLNSAFGVEAWIEDMNQDGTRDVTKLTTLTTPIFYVSIAYNSAANPGFFALFHDNIHTFQPYAMDVGDLNNDGRLDLMVGDDSADRYRYNTGVDALGRAIWGASKTYAFLSGGDDGFTGITQDVDLDLDGWNDVVVASNDVDVGPCARRTHIYHNPGGAIGSQITLVEEAQQSSTTSGWKGVVGMTVAELEKSYDVAIFDLDGDQAPDMVLGRCNEVSVWLSTMECAADLGSGGPGNARLTLCGEPLATGQSANLLLSGAPALAPVFLVISAESTPLAILGGTLLANPPSAVAALAANPAGKVQLPGISGGGGPASAWAQAVILDPAQAEYFAFSNAIRADFLP